jgi:hypothetical protein
MGAPVASITKTPIGTPCKYWLKCRRVSESFLSVASRNVTTAPVTRPSSQIGVAV